MRHRIAKLLGIKESTTPKPTAEQLAVPLAIIPFDGGIVINGRHKDDDDETDDIVVGLQDAPTMSYKGEFKVHNCIVENIDGTLERAEPNAEQLLFGLAAMLGYTVTRK